MKANIQRRVFLSGILGSLAVGPFAVNYFLSGKRLSGNHFDREYKKYQSLLDIPVTPIDYPSPFSYSLQPPIGREWKYVLFSPSILPKGLSLAVAGEPDSFFIRQGNLQVFKTLKSQILVHGGDDVFKSYSPTAIYERDKNEVTLLAHDGKLSAAKVKGTETTNYRDLQFSNLLALQSPPSSPLAIGTKWMGKIGRIHPFTKFTTNYEVAGFSQIAGRKTIDIRFSAHIPNLLKLPGVAEEAVPEKCVVRCEQEGHAWFDLESGFLVRQEAEMASTVTGIPDAGKNEFLTNTKILIQLFEV